MTFGRQESGLGEPAVRQLVAVRPWGSALPGVGYEVLDLPRRSAPYRAVQVTELG